MLVLGIIFILLFVQGILTEVLKAKPIAYISSVLLIALFLYITVGITYTADYDMYYYFFKYDVKTDYVFTQLSKVFKSIGWSFHDLYAVHIIMITLLLMLFVLRYNVNVFYIFLFFITIEFVHFTNQIRYFLGFAFLLLSFHSLYKKNYVYFGIYAALTLLTHIALVVLFTFIPIFYVVKSEIYLKRILVFAGFCFLLVFGLFNTGIGKEISHFGEYFSASGISSFAGGLYNTIPSIILIAYLYLETKKYIANHPDCFDDKKFIFLFKLTFYTIIFIPASFFLQIAGHRYVMPFVIVYAIYFLYMIRDYNANLKIAKLGMFSFVGFVVCLFLYVFPSYVLDENHYLNETEWILESIKYLKYKEW